MPINRVWRPFKIEVIKSLPDRRGIYELGDAKQVIVYIGSSNSSVRERLLKHIERKRFMHVKHFRFQKPDEWYSPQQMEKKHCNLFKKRNNGKLPRLQKRSPLNTW